MSIHIRPRRSALYMPGSKARALEKARNLAADVLLLDLEDAVGPAEKAQARGLVVEALQEGGYGNRELVVRINGFDTPWGEDDLAAIATCKPDAILLPKVEEIAVLDDVAAHLADAGAKDTAIWAMMETPRGILRAEVIADRLASINPNAAFVIGTNDLVKELEASHVPDRAPVMHALQQCMLAARAAGIACIDGVYNAFKDEEGLRAEAIQGRDMGMDGKSLIHPLQLDAVNAVFAPDDAEIELARRQIAAFEETRARGEAVAVVDGKIVENLHVATAQTLLAKAEAIAALEA